MRLTPAVTTRGFGPDEITRVSEWIVEILSDINDESRVDGVREIRCIAARAHVAGTNPAGLVDGHTRQWRNAFDAPYLGAEYRRSDLVAGGDS